MIRSLRHRATEAEQMDAADLDPAIYAQVLRDLAAVNRITMAARPTLRFLTQAIGDQRQFTLLDVGFGHGDMLRRIASWAARRGITATLIGVDLNPRSAIIAGAATDPALAIQYRTGDYRDQPENFDLIISSLVAHHMDEAELIDFLRFMNSRAQSGWFVNDLHRHWLAYLGFPWLAGLMRWHPIVRHDGHLSIARSFRVEDWQGLLDQAGVTARIARHFPFRLCVAQTR